MDARLLLCRAVEARINAWDHPLVDERETAAAEVGLMLQELVREQLPQAVPAYATLEGVKELSADINADRRLHIVGAFYVLGADGDRMLPVEVDLHAVPRALSVVKVAGEESAFAMPTGERQFRRRMEDIRWVHRLTFQLT